ncbi:MAG: hypothetical protein AAF772_09650, partial [Acidobacteriota bacterium]
MDKRGAGWDVASELASMDDSETPVGWGHTETINESMPHGLASADLRVLGLTVLCHPDLARIGERAVLDLSSSGVHEAQLSRLAPLFSAVGSAERRPLMDPRISRTPLHLRADGAGGVTLRVGQGSRLRVEIDGTAIDGQHHAGAADVARGVVVLLADRVALLLHRMELLPQMRPSFGLVGQSAGLCAVRRHIAQVADLDVSCLILGESGTG